jgi:hypothetical protein
MIEAIIRWSIANRVLVLVLALASAAAGIHAVRSTPVDAIPDLSDTQVIVRTMFPGQAPEVVERQVTYPLTTALMAVPGAHTVRGFSMFGDSFIYVLFDDGTDPYWARSRVQEYLSQVAGALPAGVTAALGPDATGVGWVYKYALVDRTGTHDLAQLRALQDWFLKFELQAVRGVSEVATMGGMVRQYQVAVDPNHALQCGRHVELAALPLLLLVIRPVLVMALFARSHMSVSERAFVAWFGVRGVGSLYYLAFAITHGLPGALVEQLTGVTLVAVALSVVFHGISVTPLMKLYESRRP